MIMSGPKVLYKGRTESVHHPESSGCYSIFEVVNASIRSRSRNSLPRKGCSYSTRTLYLSSRRRPILCGSDTPASTLIRYIRPTPAQFNWQPRRIRINSFSNQNQLQRCCKKVFLSWFRWMKSIKRERRKWKGIAWCYIEKVSNKRVWKGMLSSRRSLLIIQGIG